MCRFSRRVRYRPDYLVLETIAFSHIVEKVRWCLDRMGADYGEEQDVGILGAVAAQRPVREEKCRHQQRARSSEATAAGTAAAKAERTRATTTEAEGTAAAATEAEGAAAANKTNMHNVHKDRITGTIFNIAAASTTAC